MNALKIIIIASLLGLMWGCGQKGDLILPEKDAKKQEQT